MFEGTCINRGGSRILQKGFLFYAGLLPKTECTEVHSGDQSAQSVENFFHLYFSVIRMGSRGTFVLCTASSRCKRIAGPGAAMCFRFLLKFRSHKVIHVHTYT